MVFVRSAKYEAGVSIDMLYRSKCVRRVYLSHSPTQRFADSLVCLTLNDGCVVVVRGMACGSAASSLQVRFMSERCKTVARMLQDDCKFVARLV